MQQLGASNGAEQRDPHVHLFAVGRAQVLGALAGADEERVRLTGLLSIGDCDLVDLNQADAALDVALELALIAVECQRLAANVQYTPQTLPVHRRSAGKGLQQIALEDEPADRAAVGQRLAVERDRQELLQVDRLVLGVRDTPVRHAADGIAKLLDIASVPLCGFGHVLPQQPLTLFIGPLLGDLVCLQLVQRLTRVLQLLGRCQQRVGLLVHACLQLHNVRHSLLDLLLQLADLGVAVVDLALEICSVGVRLSLQVRHLLLVLLLVLLDRLLSSLQAALPGTHVLLVLGLLRLDERLLLAQDVVELRDDLLVLLPCALHLRRVVRDPLAQVRHLVLALVKLQLARVQRLALHSALRLGRLELLLQLGLVALGILQVGLQLEHTLVLLLQLDRGDGQRIGVIALDAVGLLLQSAVGGLEIAQGLFVLLRAHMGLLVFLRQQALELGDQRGRLGLVQLEHLHLAGKAGGLAVCLGLRLLQLQLLVAQLHAQLSLGLGLATGDLLGELADDRVLLLLGSKQQHRLLAQLVAELLVLIVRLDLDPLDLLLRRRHA
eukprot:m.43945 g.43945  ORF g.43945 m.43945 type:complete len:552 (-) comp5803_c2_seq1:1708-3363(-)